jgi:ENT domain
MHGFEFLLPNHHMITFLHNIHFLLSKINILLWQGKEGLITELRKELRVSDVEHRQILALVSTDKLIKLLRYARNISKFTDYI